MEPRIQFQIATAAFDSVRWYCPAYSSKTPASPKGGQPSDITVGEVLSECGTPCPPAVAGISGWTNVRSAERHDMIVPRTRTHLGRRSLYVAARLSGTHFRSIFVRSPPIINYQRTRVILLSDYCLKTCTSFNFICTFTSYCSVAF